MTGKIQFKRGLKEKLPILSPAEIAMTIDTKEIYMGSSTGNIKLINENDMKEYIAFVTEYGARSILEIGFDDFDSSEAIRNALLNNDKIFFPNGIYYVKNIELFQGKEVYFGTDVTLKIPNPKVNDRCLIVGAVDGGLLDINKKTKMTKVIGPVTIDVSEVDQSNVYYTGIMVSGAINFEIRNIFGKGFKSGFTVLLTRTYGSKYLIPENGYIENINMDGEWSAVAIVSGKNIKINGVNSSRGNGVNIEVDDDVVPLDTLAVENIDIRNVSVSGGTALNINTHKHFINDIRAKGIKSIEGSLFTLHAGDSIKYRIQNVVIEDGYGDGKGNCDYGADSPNDVEGDGIILRNLHVKNYNKNGFRINGADWYNCSAEFSGEDGFCEATPDYRNLSKNSSFYNCKSNNNNVNNVTNGSGFKPSSFDRAFFYNCEATDSRTTKLQQYGVICGYRDVFAINCKFDGNAKNRIGPLDKRDYDAKIYDYFSADGNKDVFKTIETTVGITQSTIIHNLGRNPSFINIKPKGNAVIWESAPSTNWEIYLTASSSVECEISIG